MKRKRKKNNKTMKKKIKLFKIFNNIFFNRN